jgi:ABC-type sulfate transport system substrate-binding protein
MISRLKTFVAVLALASSAFAGSSAFAQGSSGTTLLNASYDVAREFYKDYNAAFVAHYKKTAGKDVKIDQSHGGSSAQARAVADGLDADVVTMNTSTDIDFLASTGVVAKDWNKQFPRTHRRPPRPCCSWCATATPRASRTGKTWSSPACRSSSSTPRPAATGAMPILRRGAT